MSTANETLLILLLAIAGELALLRRGQRRLFWATAAATRSRLIAYALAAPGTALHEASHVLFCHALGVRITGRPRLFWPRRTPEGDVILGSVPHARTDPLRQALISTAPLVIVPALLTLATLALLGPHALTRMPQAVGDVAWWRAALWIYVSLSCGQAVFPSPGDRIGLVGALSLVAFGGALVAVVLALGGGTGVRELLAVAVGILALPAVAAATSLLVLNFVGRGSRRLV